MGTANEGQKMSKTQGKKEKAISTPIHSSAGAELRSAALGIGTKSFSAPKRSRWGSGHRPHNKRQRCHGGGVSQTPTLLPLRLHYRGRLTHLEKERKRSHPEMEGAESAEKWKGAVTKKGLIYKKRRLQGGRSAALGKGLCPGRGGWCGVRGWWCLSFPIPSRERLLNGAWGCWRGAVRGGSAGTAGLSFANLK